MSGGEAPQAGLIVKARAPVCGDDQLEDGAQRRFGRFISRWVEKSVAGVN
jgi:hypothetical protein